MLLKVGGALCPIWPHHCVDAMFKELYRVVVKPPPFEGAPRHDEATLKWD